MKVLRLKYIFIALILAMVCSSCEDWLNLYPENSQTTDQYWQTKEDVEAVVAAGYNKLQGSTDNLFVWGEIRGNGIDIIRSTVDDNIKAAKKIRDMDILPTNSYAKWEKMYQIINMANSVIHYAPEVLKRDASFNEAQMNSFMAESYFQRALAYFYLVRTFKNVPLVLRPYVNDEQIYEVPAVTESAVINQIITDLKAALSSAKEFYPEIDYDNPINSKGRATKWAIHALLADIYLWNEEYDNCIASCDAIISSKRVGLISSENWYTNFYPGNSNESIFEIQFDYDLSQTNSFYKWFETDWKYSFSENTFMLFEETKTLGDVRGEGSSISFKEFSIWKYIGLYPDVNAGAKRASTDYDQNFIIYRLAEIYFMKAEALAMQGDLVGATEIVNKIRSRAGVSVELNVPSNELEMLKLILNEKGREFVAEGKNWFDLLRVGKRNNYRYKEFFIDEILKVISLNKISIVSSKLIDTNSHYLPIHQDELDANSLLKQNPYYESLGN